MEIAFTSADRLRLKTDKSDENINSKILSFFFTSSRNFISTILAGNYMSLVVYGILVAQLVKTHLIIKLTNSSFILILLQTLIAVIVILITNGIIPKKIFRRHANSALTFFAIPMFIFYIVLYPVSKVCSVFSYVLLKLFGITTGKEADNKIFGKEDLDNFIQSSIDKSENRKEIETEVKIFQNALDFSSIKIRDCIVPRPEVIAIDLDTDLDTLKTRFIESGISKIIVYKDNIDNIIGYIHSSEMFRNADNWKNCIQQIPIVPETMGANKLMKLFMQQKKTLAVVVDEFGGTTGIVSLEDLVEEIFGEIEDEHDTTSYIAKQTDENEYILSARLEIEKANEMFNLGLPESDDYITIGGFILKHYQNFPKLHEIVKIGHFQFKIIKLTTTKIELVKLKVIE